MAEGNSILLEAIKRFLLIIAAYLLCCVLTGFSVLGLLAIADPPSDLSTFSFGLFITVIISFFAALPAAIFICVAEHFSLRHWWAYSVFAAVAGVGIGTVMMTKPWFPVAGLGLGVLMGLIFWAIAGRNAGILKRQQQLKAHKMLMTLLGVTALSSMLLYFPLFGFFRF
jgi:hypothetical protein